MNAKNSNIVWSCGSRGRGHVTMLHRVSWISITSSHPCSRQSPILRHEHSWEQRTLGTKQKESQMASYYKSYATSLKPSFQCILHGLFSDCTLLVLTVVRNCKKEPYCCWFFSMQQLSGEKGNIKNQLIYWSAKEKRSCLGLQWDCCCLQHDLKMQKTWERWLLVWLLLISVDGWLTGGSRGQTKAFYDQHNQCDISTAT